MDSDFLAKINVDIVPQPRLDLLGPFLIQKLKRSKHKIATINGARTAF